MYEEKSRGTQLCQYLGPLGKVEGAMGPNVRVSLTDLSLSVLRALLMEMLSKRRQKATLYKQMVLMLLHYRWMR